jgi:hypothetical protein
MFENELIADLGRQHRLQGDAISVIGGIEDFAGINCSLIPPENDARTLRHAGNAGNQATLIATLLPP